MANSYIRIYDKPNDGGKPATWLGLSATPSYEIGKKEPEFFAFFEERGFTISTVDSLESGNTKRIRNLGAVSWKYLEVIPPLPEDTYAELGRVCKKLVDPGPNDGVLMDNRRDPFPTTPYSSSSKVIYRW